ncbi:hypothetical protein BH24ACT16_BH24ACT16_03000 [soil metagenome]
MAGKEKFRWSGDRMMRLWNGDGVFAGLKADG